ncbi:MAG: hypothetical protein COB02_02090 [Candidatus Cloacimonadota bacterium]|nr:MAG: hypothetical protein COB02_02090 [Candidatus Cloacimonadota bacterium]
MKLIQYISILSLFISSLSAGINVLGNIVNGKTPIKNAVLWIEIAGHKAKRKPRIEKMLQRGKEFFPKVMAAPVNTEVWFPNEDPIFHNIFSYNKVKKLDLGQYKGSGHPVVFEKSGVYPIGCEIHPWMSAYIIIVDTEFFAKSNFGGKFTLKNLKPGIHTLNIWSPELKKQISREVDLKNGINHLSISIEPSEMKKKRKKRKKKKKQSNYGSY